MREEKDSFPVQHMQHLALKSPPHIVWNDVSSAAFYLKLGQRKRNAIIIAPTWHYILVNAGMQGKARKHLRIRQK